MRLLVYVSLVVSALHFAISQVPDVYDFCNALLHNEETEDASPMGCHSRCPQGAPGKRGPEGQRGPPGPKGDQGQEGTCDTLKTRLDAHQGALSSLILKLPDVLVDLCGLGMKSNAIPDSAITTTSQWSVGWAGSKGRIDHATNCWIAKPSEVGQWIQIDLGKPTVITGVMIQGRPNVNQWVKTYKIACAINPNSQTWAMHDGEEKIFMGNTDSNSKVSNFLPTTMSCRYVRLYPQSWNGHISMRMELLGEDCLAFMP